MFVPLPVPAFGIGVGVAIVVPLLGVLPALEELGAAVGDEPIDGLGVGVGESETDPFISELPDGLGEGPAVLVTVGFRVVADV